MTHEAFIALLEHRIAAMRQTLDAKSREYSTASDKLHNFKRAAVMQAITPAAALRGMLAKHLVAIFDMIDDTARRSPQQIDEKIGDAINYLVLLEAIWKETPWTPRQ